MTKAEILALDKLETNEQLEEAIKFLDVYLDGDFENLPENELRDFDKLSDLIYEYEEHMDFGEL